MTRDYVSEMRAIIDAETASGPYVSGAVAEHVVEKLRATDRELLDGWLHSQAVHFVWQMINDRDRSIRAHAHHTNKVRKFQRDASSGDVSSWLDVPYTVSDGSRRKLGELTKPDLLFVRSMYEDRMNESKMKAAFFTALAAKVKSRTVADHLTSEQIGRLFTSLIV